MSEKIAILGAGAFGTALACASARNNNETIIWGRDEEICSQITNHHKNEKYLGDTRLPKTLKADTNLDKVLAEATIILVAMPAQKISSAAKMLTKFELADTPIVLCAKGIDQQTSLLPSQTMLKLLPNANITSLSGPSFAKDIANNLPTALTIASKDISTAQALAKKLSDPYLRLYASDDILGVELGGALKNVIALSVGVCRGLKLGASAEAALISRGFTELSRLATKLGACPQTLSGLSGLGDLVLTCSSPQSRNFSYGMNLGMGKQVTNLPLAEGAYTATIADKIAEENKINSPIISAVAKLVAGTLNPTQAVQQLLARPLRQETETGN